MSEEKAVFVNVLSVVASFSREWSDTGSTELRWLSLPVGLGYEAGSDQGLGWSGEGWGTHRNKHCTRHETCSLWGAKKDHQSTGLIGVQLLLAISP